MNCDDAIDSAARAADGELDAGHAREVEAHAAALRPTAPANWRAARETAAGCSPRTICAITRPGIAARAHRRRDAEAAAGHQTAAHCSKGFASAARSRRWRPCRHRASSSCTTRARIACSATRSPRICARCRPIISPTCCRATSIPSSRGSTAGSISRRRCVDFTAQGFTLIGGRLDFIDGKPVAALVYRRRAHVINSSSARRSAQAPQGRSCRSCRASTSCAGAMAGSALLAVSDLNRDELEEFEQVRGRGLTLLRLANSALMRQIDGDVLALRVAVEHSFERELAADAALFVAAVGMARRSGRGPG